MKKKYLTIIVITLICMGIKNLSLLGQELINGDFELGSSTTVEGWGSHESQQNISSFSWSPDEGIDGSGCIIIETPKSSANTAYYWQTVEGLTPNKYYRLDGWIKGENVGGEDVGNDEEGVSLRLNRYNVSTISIDTFEWKKFTTVDKADENGKLDVACQLGHLESIASGKVWFDNLELFEARHFESDHFRVFFDDADFDSITDENLARWLDHLDTAYHVYADLVGYIPFNGDKMDIIPVYYYPGGLAVAGNPIKWHKPFIGSSLKRINDNDDWSFGIMHEISHNFDDTTWNFDSESSANAKMFYVLDSLKGKVCFEDIYYTGTEILEEYEQMYNDAKEEFSASGTPHMAGYVYYYCKLSQEIEWQPYKDTYRELYSKPEDMPESRVELFFRFMYSLANNANISSIYDLIPEDDINEIVAWIDENKGPIINFNIDREVEVFPGATLDISANCRDDKCPKDDLKYQWSSDQPEKVKFNDTTLADVSVLFSEKDSYILELKVYDGLIYNKAKIKVEVKDIILVNPIVDRKVLENVGSVRIDLKDVFSVKEGNTLTYTASSSNNDVSTVSVNGNTLTIIEVDTGTTNITVLADNGMGATLSDTFQLSIILDNIESDRDALMALYNSTNGPDWRNSTNWDTPEELENWDGLEVNDDGRVISVKLRSNNLSGSIPYEIGNLIHLTYLDLSWNTSMDGNIPTGIGNLKKLTDLDLSSCKLNGKIPEEIGNLDALTYLSLAHNKLEGAVPSTIGNLANLEILNLSSNELDSLNLSLTNLKMLKSLELQRNNFSGILPSHFGELVSLTSLNLSNNNFKDTIPFSIGKLVNLTSLDLSNNGFSDTIPSSIGNLINLTSLILFNNELTRMIPHQIGHLTNLTILDLRNNYIDSIPASLANLTMLDRLILSSNKFSGTIPDAIGELINLTTLELHNNEFDNVPSNIGNLTQLVELNLSYNKFDSIPSNITELSSLNNLDFSENRLKGSMPEFIFNLENLMTLNLEDNELSGSIPEFPENIELSVKRNYFTFEAIENSINVGYNLSYNPQLNFPLKEDTIFMGINQDFSIDITDISKFVLGGENNRYQWFKNGVEITPVSESPVLNLPNVTMDDAGVYTCQVSNTVVEYFTIKSEGITLEAITFGDANCDGVADIVDALLTAQYYDGLIDGEGNCIEQTCDVNQDGIIDTVDASLIAQYYVGLIPELPVPPAGTTKSAKIDPILHAQAELDALLLSLSYEPLTGLNTETMIINNPNPFSSVTEIEYSLSGPATISLIVFDASGKTLEQLVANEYKEAGTHIVSFNGDKLPNGTYYCRLTDNDGKVLSHKMILQK